MRHGVDITHAPFDGKKKWADRLRFGMSKTGKPWSEAQEYEDKRAVAEMVAKAPDKALHPSKEDLIKAFIQMIERRLNEISVGLKH